MRLYDGTEVYVGDTIALVEHGETAKIVANLSSNVAIDGFPINNWAGYSTGILLELASGEIVMVDEIDEDMILVHRSRP